MSAQPPEPPSDQPATGAAPPPPAPPPSAPPPADSSTYGSPSYPAAPSYGTLPAGGPYAAGPQPGGLLERFLARLIDGVLVGIVNLVLVFFVAAAIDTYAVTVVLSIITGAISPDTTVSSRRLAIARNPPPKPRRCSARHRIVR